MSPLQMTPLHTSRQQAPRLPSCLRLAAVALIAALAFAAPARAHADTFQVFNLGDDDKPFLGLTSTGLAFFESASGNYLTYYDGALDGTSATAPIFTPDNGTLCTPSVPAGGVVARGICNNGLDAFTGTLSSSQNLNNAGLYFGPTFENIYGDTGIGGSYPYVLAMNSFGDIIFEDQLLENWYEAVDLTTAVTPEPSSVLLLATGLLALGGTLLYRRRPQPQS